MAKAPTRIIATLLALLLLVVGWVAISRDSPPPPSPVPRTDSPTSDTPSIASETAIDEVAPATSIDKRADVTVAARTEDASVILAARWGSGRGELGRSRPKEGNPEGPMSFAHADDELFVLDQVNGRVARYDANGRVRGTFEVTTTTQDLTVARDGTLALLDRLVDKAVHLVDKNGRPIGQLPLSSDRVGAPGLVTGVFVDGKDVYVEKEHGVLTRIGSTDGSAADQRELGGRPSKDGTLLLMAVLSPLEARVNVNAFDRKLGSLRFARAVTFPRPTRQIMLLDTDMRGTIYLGVLGGSPELVHIACLDPSDGRALGRLAVPTSEVPEESFRDFAVGDDGTIVLSLRTEDGIEYRSAHCP